MYLREADILRFLPEALAADVETVFPDQSGLVGANAARYSTVSRAFSMDVAKAKGENGHRLEEWRNERAQAGNQGLMGKR